MFIRVGTKRPRYVFLNHIVTTEIVKGRTSVYVQGETEGDNLVVGDINVVEPYAVLIKDVNNTSHYVNFKDMGDAIEYLATLNAKIHAQHNAVLSADEFSELTEHITEEMKNYYGYED